ncbi:MAG: hypothetical protein CFE21_21195 [Bacteroidetes bacterium B1(2017)]|nr:MAG: hypothetical protein CFE21_21195 [Bacteroidetes bacterium B1(2017)]
MAFAQVVYEPEFKTSYNFLSRMAQRGIISLDDVVLPLSRKYIQEKLSEVYFRYKELTLLENKELDFYLKDYLLDRISIDTMHSGSLPPILFKKKINDRWRFVAYRNKDFTINLQPIIGTQLDLRQGETVFKRSSGFWLYGYIHKNFGYSFSFNEISENGPLVDFKKSFTPEPGFFGIASPGTTNYSDFRTNLSYNWKWGTISTGREKTQWGYGANGKVVLSNKAPAYPFVRLDVKPATWLSFNMTAMWLSSGVVDSAYVRPTTVAMQTQIDFVPKYLSTHSFTFMASKKLSFSIGESIIFNNRLKLGYLIPLAFWRAQSHYDGENGGGTNTLSNSQFFLQASSRNHLPNTHLYFNFFVDEMSFKKFFDKALMRNQTGYCAGLSVTNIPFKNGYFQTDYTRTRPYNYVHFVPAQTYTNREYNLGHWIGPNADQWYSAYTYQFIRGLKGQITFNTVRAGTVGKGFGQQYERGTQFLWGSINRYNTLASNFTYEITHDVFLKGSLAYQQTLINNALDKYFHYSVALNISL